MDDQQWVAVPVSDDVLHVAGGRRAGYRLFGADTRPVLLYMHGTPSSRAGVGDYEPGAPRRRYAIWHKTSALVVCPLVTVATPVARHT